MEAKVNGVLEEWESLSKEYDEFQEIQKDYIKSVESMCKLQTECVKSASHHRYRMGQILQTLESFKLSTSEEKAKVSQLKQNIKTRYERLKDMESVLPRKNGLYLKVILGNVSVNLMNKDDRFKYKEEYEHFKFIVTIIILILSFLDIIVSYRALDSILHFLQVWYYCTLTIRESILVVNGSRMKGWWRINHFITTVQAGVLIVWPDGLMYDLFRKQFMWYTCYTSILQFLQFSYQQGCLYRLRALGERYNMDITIEGFHSWMWKGLSFLLPFLYFGYMFQLYNAYTLYKLSDHPKCIEWQVLWSAAIFFVLFLGNTLTTSRVIHQKIKEKLQLSEIKNKIQ